MSSLASSLRRERTGEPSAVELIEESVQLLRRAPLVALAVYYAGAVPFVLALLYFWAHTSWFHPPEEQLAWGALGLAGLFLVMKAAQAEFCARLTALRLGDTAPAWSWRRIARLTAAQLRLQPWATLAGIPVSIVALPAGWWYAYAQSATVLGEEPKLHGEAVEQARLWPKQNHVGLLLLSILALCTWANFAGAFYLIPWMANRFLGIDNLFGFSGWWLMNTTFLASVSALTWLAIDPLVKAFYTLRVFHGRARATGEDVRVEFRLAQASRAASMRAMVALALGWLAFDATRDVHAAEPAPASAPVVKPAELDRALDEVLSTGDFRWRLPPPANAVKKEQSTVARFAQQGIDTIREMFRMVGRWISAVRDWIDRRFSKSEDKERASETTPLASPGMGLEWVRMLLYVFIGLAVLLILWVVWLMVSRARRSTAPIFAARAVTTAKPDLRDENVQAAQLPLDGWLALAHEQMARGEWRLAWRALYLATLARLAAEGLVSLAKFKTNLDYERELRRRALSRTEIVARFAQRRRAFEDVWYGREQAAEAAVREWLTELERPANTP